MPRVNNGRIPRLGFLGAGRIGQKRMRPLLESGAATVIAVADVNEQCCREAAELSGGAAAVRSLEELLDLNPQGVVISTPNALHVDQCVKCFEAGCPVFCQKPLGRTAEEAARIVAAARKADRYLGVDFSYRYLDGVRKIRDLFRSGALGRLYAADLEFHNAYGPDKAWFYDISQAGGGCVLDLGVHLVDLSMWMLDFPRLTGTLARLFSHGLPLTSRDTTEDYAEIRLDFSDDSTARIACSWKLHAGHDAIIRASFFGTKGAAAVYNVNGSFYDFTAEHYDGCRSTVLSQPPDAWSGRAIIAWAERLGRSPAFDPAAEHYVNVSQAIDLIYADQCCIPSVRTSAA